METFKQIRKKMKLFVINLLFTFQANKKKDERRKSDMGDYIGKFLRQWESHDAVKPECFSSGSTRHI